MAAQDEVDISPLLTSVTHHVRDESGYVSSPYNEQGVSDDSAEDSGTHCRLRLENETGKDSSDSPCNKPDNLCESDVVGCDFVRSKPQLNDGAECIADFDCLHTIEEAPVESKDSEDVSAKDLDVEDTSSPVIKCAEHPRGLEEEEEGNLKATHCTKKSANKDQRELQEIYSESQRMVRESLVHLPYHKPPRLSLKEFLVMRRGKTVEDHSLSSSHSASLVKIDTVESRCSLSEGEGKSTKEERVEERSQPALKKRQPATLNLFGPAPQLSSGPLVISSCPGIRDLLERFAKHTTEKNKRNRCTEPTAGERASCTQVASRASLKNRLLQQLTEKREKTLQERLRQHKVYEDEIEEQFLPDSDSEYSDAEDKSNNGGDDADVQERDEEDDEVQVRDEEDNEAQVQDEEDDEDKEEIVCFRKRPKNYNPFIEGDEADDEERAKGGVDEEDNDGHFLRMESLADDKRGSWDSTLDDLNVFSPISGLTSVRDQRQHNKDFASRRSSPAKSPTSVFSLYRSEILIENDASEVQANDVPWVCNQQHVSTQQEMDELIGLCSGSFNARTNQGTLELDVDTVKGCESSSEVADEESDEECDEECDEGVDADDDADGTAVAPGHKKNGFAVQDFFEDEAELSGSDVGSDDEEDADEEQVLADLLAADTQPLDEESIREEVGRLHLKHLLDRDKRELKVYQEMLLEDGDLHSEGGRQRKFRWKCSNDDFASGPVKSDSEEEDAGAEEDVSWRLQRFEREQWLRDQESKDHVRSPVKVHNQLRVVTSVRRGEKESKKVVCGSYLRMGGAALSKIAERLKVNRSTDNVGSLTTKNFVFRSVDKAKERKRPSSMPLPPSCKKIKVSPLQANSIFDRLQH